LKVGKRGSWKERKLEREEVGKLECWKVGKRGSCKVRRLES
jgi:hypothetical protein